MATVLGTQTKLYHPKSFQKMKRLGLAKLFVWRKIFFCILDKELDSLFPLYRLFGFIKLR